MPEMKTCIQCAAELPDEAVFCPECGTRQPSGANAGQSVDSAAGTAASESATPDLPRADPMAKEPPVSMDPFAVSAPPAAPAQPAAPESGKNPVQAANPAQSFQYTMPAAPPEQPAQPGYGQQPYPNQGQQPPAQPGWGQQAQPIQNWQQPPVRQTAPTAPAKGKGMKKQAKAEQPGLGNGDPGKVAAKLPVATIVILGLTLVALIYWFMMYNSPKLPEFDFSASTANGVVFSFLLMSILAIAGAALFRFNMRGRKLAVLGDILLVVVFLVMFYGISMTMYKETNLFYKLFIGITGG